MIFPTTYLGSINYYRAWLRDNNALIEQCETYTKQTERNHCQIVGTNGVQTLTIPVERMHDRKILTRDIKIAYQEKWQHQHWEALKSAYRHSPYYDYYAEYLEPFYTKRYDFLIDFNTEMMAVVLRLLDVQKPIKLTTDFIGVDNKQLLLANSEYHNNYYQVFQEKIGFISNMSIIDLLFNLGTESYQVLFH